MSAFLYFSQVLPPPITTKPTALYAGKEAEMEGRMKERKA
jgi:hypothetical protein